MFHDRLTQLLVQDRRRDLFRAAGHAQDFDEGATPVTRVTLRYASAADGESLDALAQLDSAPAPVGPMLVAEIDGRLRAALPLDGSRAIVDPFHRGVELVELLRLRARQLRSAA
jgi:hypothetical protein